MVLIANLHQNYPDSNTAKGSNDRAFAFFISPMLM